MSCNQCRCESRTKDEYGRKTIKCERPFGHKGNHFRYSPYITWGRRNRAYNVGKK